MSNPTSVPAVTFARQRRTTAVATAVRFAPSAMRMPISRRRVVAALESIRLQLLRMHAGAGSVEGMTADLGSARDLSNAVQHLLEGKRQVGEVLRTPKPRSRGDTPVPA
jgi:hypothetical protein